MARRSWFSRAAGRSGRDARANAERVPSDLFEQCPNRSCGMVLYRKELEKDLKVCKKCGYHFPLTAQERVNLLFDEGTFEPFDFGLKTGDPLEFPGYRETLDRYRAKTGMQEAILAGQGLAGGIGAAICVTDFSFLAGSMNSVVGETIARTLEEAAAARLPMILVSGSGGGARMHEGLLSLMQMAKTAAALERYDRTGAISICILTDYTMGGVLASWASLGDVILAEPGANVGFTGGRVAAKVQTERAPENFRTAEFSFEHGMIDLVTPRSQLKETVARLLSIAAAGKRGARERVTSPDAKGASV